ncbi:MAG: hypothetical protein HYZ15_03295 [Sphingobacteriales bacterium]|nr:hypothetical protein [Sphingobacteriales bacterium]
MDKDNSDIVPENPIKGNSVVDKPSGDNLGFTSTAPPEIPQLPPKPISGTPKGDE